ncbi:uncharacterized protein BXZ73DRAFT_33250, partial [Epithele typhae]|uniref:uncharacterized protein n=1 Tax=Epithele typhae TaxID=378194 RepID=UPI002008ABE8
EETGSLPFRRDKGLWFSDGTLVLVVEDIAFRVYKGILTQHSSVLQTLLSHPTSLATEGVAVERTRVDDTQDWRYLLRILV